MIYLLGKRDPFISVAVAFAALVFAFVLLIVITRLGAGSDRRAQIESRGTGNMTDSSPNPVATGHGVAVAFQDMHRWYGSVHALERADASTSPRAS